MRYKGRVIDAVALWSEFVDFPGDVDERDIYLPKVQCPNPDHDTEKRHFQINVRDGLVHCFAHCGISGSWEHAICVILGLYDKWQVDDAKDNNTRKYRLRKAYAEARANIFKHKRTGKISVRASAGRNKGRVGEGRAIRDSELDFESFLPPIAVGYLEKRGISGRAIATWGIGYDPDDRRIVIPAKDIHGQTKFLIKRAVRTKDHPKYLYQPEGVAKTNLLFGACQIDLGMVRSEGLVLQEGSLDTIITHENGIPIATAILGTGISDAQVAIVSRIRPKRIYLMFDKDSAGIANIEIAARKLRKYPIFVCRFPSGKSDPGELTPKEAVRSIERAMPLLKFIRKIEEMGISLNIRPNAKSQRKQEVIRFG